MIAPCAPERTANPFATRFIRPGRIAPHDAEGRPLAVAALATRARDCRESALVGPHGNGKSNLLVALADELATHGPVSTVQLRSIRDGLRIFGWLARARAGAFLCIDGWERAGGVMRCGIRIAARWRRCGLVVTSHRPCGLPTLIACQTTPTLLEHVVAALPSHHGLIEPADLAEAFARHAGNIREALLDLYDRFEERAREAESVGPKMTAVMRVSVVPATAEEFTKQQA